MKGDTINKLGEVNKFNVSQAETGENSTFLESPIIHISPLEARAILRTHQILCYILQNPSCTPYKISKELKLDYSTTSKTCKDLEYCRLIYVRVEVGDNNRTHKKLYVPTEESQ